MSLRRQVISEFDEKISEKEKQYIVNVRQKIPGIKPSFMRFLGSRLFFPIILSPVVMIFKQGGIFLVIMWVGIIAKASYDYNDLYPPTRLATPEEVETYKELRRYYALKYYDAYQTGAFYLYSFEEQERAKRLFKELESEYGPHWQNELRKESKDKE